MTGSTQHSPGTGAIAHVSFSGDFGGREKVAVELCRSLRGLGLECLLYVVVEERAGAQRNDNLMNALGDVSRFARVFRTHSRFSPRLLYRLAASLREQGVRVVHCHCYKSLYYAVLMRMLGLLDGSVVYTLHGLVLPSGAMSWFIRNCQLIGLRMSDGVIGCSREILASSFPDPGKVRTASIINAIKRPEPEYAALESGRAEARRELVERYGLDPEGLVVINVGRICPQKNFPLYLELIRREMTENPGSNINYLIVGNGELQADMEALAESLGIRHRVVFTGFVSDMDTVYRGADILVQTSTWEGTPMCLLEARSYGLPIVAPAVGGNVDVVESGLDGTLYPTGDLAALWEGYAAYVSSGELRQRHGRAAFDQTGRKFGTRDWARRHVAFYGEVAEGVKLRETAQ
ncbi:glycosyl transferase group 1 [Pseudodesulfovibrio mercurii]|uniref:Glycosyl transferase group 1 n=1 Tax=Pseudodesulfovibrio mercurii TaxID=641491 RepID=F0JCA9_9BACT|nr:glycosyltransferase [Pseudodesulfovibrio mercurii]EGB14407.1 glycosyl transferase group 1 [Pseudodesulfovibrio mercurii]